MVTRRGASSRDSARAHVPPGQGNETGRASGSETEFAPGSASDPGVGRPHRRIDVSALVLVALGGALGTLVRFGVGELIHGGAAATLAVNLVGAFALGVLVTLLGRRTVEAHHTVSVSLPGALSPARAERLRLLLGTGVLGGFTTYSGLAAHTGELLQAGQSGGALAYAGVTLVIGLIASMLGIWIGGLGRAAGTELGDTRTANTEATS